MKAPSVIRLLVMKPYVSPSVAYLWRTRSRNLEDARNKEVHGWVVRVPRKSMITTCESGSDSRSKKVSKAC